MRGATFPPNGWEVINTYLNQFQAMIDAIQQPPATIKLADWRGTTGRLPSRDAAICEAIRSYSPSSLTAKDVEVNADAAVRKRRAQHRR
jgi:hypothetical protein